MNGPAVGSIVNLLQSTEEGPEGWMIAQQGAPQNAAHNMASLIEELQALALNSEVPVSDLLLTGCGKRLFDRLGAYAIAGHAIL